MKRSGGGGRRNLYQVLRDRIQIADKEFWTVEKMVDHLRSSYRDYSRIKVHLLQKNVKRVMMEIDNSNHDGHTQIVNKRRKIEDTVDKSSSSELEVVDVKEVDLLNEEDSEVMDVNLINEVPRLGGRSNNSLEDEKTHTMFKDLGGISETIEELKTEVVLPLLHPQLLPHIGGKPMAGILLHGPPGCGKTKLANAIANEAGRPFYKISATELVSGVSGASEENIRELFAKAHRTAPSVVFIDEIDAIASKRDNLQREMEKRIVTQLMTCMDDGKAGYVLVIGATNRPDALDPALRRPGRFDREIMLNIPNEVARVEILSVLTRHLKVEGSLDLLKIAKLTPAFVGADLMALANKACHLAIKRVVGERKYAFSKEQNDGDHNEDYLRRPFSEKEMKNIFITMTDFEEAVKMIQPALRREGFSAIPNIKWDNVLGLDLVRQEFNRYIVNPIKFPENYKHFRMHVETGFLLYGPPGCGKTLIAKAVANEAGANFIHIKGPELLNKYVGESELAVRTIFSRARTCSPCILFFDEVDALAAGNEVGSVIDRVVKQLLIELDGGEQRKGVYVIGATNRPEVMDRALLRPGRFGKVMYVPLPSPDERGMILKALGQEVPIDVNLDLMALGKATFCDNLNGADLCALMDEASMIALEDVLSSTDRNSGPPMIKYQHFMKALEKIRPSVSDEQINHYKHLSERFKAGRACF